MTNMFDQKLFYQINQVWTHASLDAFFSYLTDFAKSEVFYALLVFALVFIYRRYRWQGLAVIFGAVIISSIADFISSEFLKTYFAHPRPEFANLPYEVILRRPSEGRFSFPSSHALDAFVISGFIFSFSKKWGGGLLMMAVLIAYSRVYCGLHFPSDVLAGSFLGLWIGLSSAAAIKWWVRHEK